MIIIKIIILYFLSITHTDDIPSTGNRLVLYYLFNGNLCVFGMFLRMLVKICDVSSFTFSETFMEFR